MSIDIKSFNQILGTMVRKVLAETPISDVTPGSVFLSFLEACAAQDFENNVAILNILELLSIDSVRNNDLDNRASDTGLTRFAAKTASGSVSILNKNITKQSTNLYSIKPSPISGQTTLFVNSTAGWAASGSLFIGRGTNSFEGPIPYTSITVFSTYSQINLGSALQQNHLSSDTVINSQGQSDRAIGAGTTVKIPSNNQNAEILYLTLRDVTLPAGEDRINNVLVVAQVPGSQGNALKSTISIFDVAPFSGAGVTNTSSFSSGTDIETDVQLRNRVKSYAASLARGTVPAIVNAVIGISDPDENKRVVSAALTQPISVGQPSLLYVDDGSGFQPSYSGQAVDVLLSKANGNEEFLQLANFPLPRPQVVNVAVGPFTFLTNMFLRVAVDGVEETIVFASSDFVNISVATVSEIIIAINNRSILFKARLTNSSNNVLLYPVDPNAETIQVTPLKATDTLSLYGNGLLNFPTQVFSYISLFHNSKRLIQKTKTAAVITIAFASWNLLIPGDLIISVDGTPAQDVTFSLNDFAGAASFALLTLGDWVTAFNKKIAGITATATPGQAMLITSNKSGNNSSIALLGGSYQAQVFATQPLAATGQASQFEVNRQTGNLRLLETIVPGDVVSAGVSDAKGFVVSASTSTGLYNLDLDGVGRPAQMVICVDAAVCNKISVSFQIGQTLTVSDQGNSRMRLLAPTTDVFKSVLPGHFIYAVSRAAGWLSASNTGLFKVIARGTHLSAGTDTYIEVLNDNIVNESKTVADITDVAGFETNVYPQLWQSNSLNSIVSATIADVVQSLNKSILGIKASSFRSNAVKITSSTENSGSIAVPVSVGSAGSLFATTLTVQANNQPLVANKVSQKDMYGFIKTLPITSSNTWLGRAVYPALTSSLNANSTQDPSPYAGAYSETISGSVLTAANLNYSDNILFTRGNNKNLVKSIAAEISTNSVGTQQGIARTVFNHVIGDEVLVAQSLKFAADDNVVCVMDEDPSIKTIEIKAARTGQVNSGSASGSFIPNTTQFSANDIDNEPGIDFGTVNVWGTTLNNTNFSDYALLMRARNWYCSGGTASSSGKMIVRAADYGSNGTLLRFNIGYPTNPNLTSSTILVDSPSFNTLTYFFGSSADRATVITAGSTVTITGPFPDTTTNFPSGVTSTGNYFDYTFSVADFTTVQVNDVLSILPGAGLSIAASGQLGIKNKTGNTARVFNPSAAVGVQTVGNAGLIHVFPLTGTSVSAIVIALNASSVLTAAAIGNPAFTITSATVEEQYVYVNNATALGYGHNPTSSSLRGYVGLYDGISWIKSFQNTNPNFTLKAPLLLNSSGVLSSVYSMNTSPNEDSSVGEFIKLVPTTIKNVQHHFTQKALSQLPIVSNIAISNSGKSVQIVSQNLGSSGAIQVLGGQANAAQTFVIGESAAVSDSSGSYLLCNASAFPNTYSIGDVVRLQNQSGVKRLSRLLASDTVSVAPVLSGSAEYYYNSKVTNFTAATTVTITDVSSSYADYSGTPLSSGIVWRWTHSVVGAESLASVRTGDLVGAYGTLPNAWSQGNKAKLAGDETVAGLPIIAVNDASHYFDVVYPFGKAMTATAIGSSGTVSVFPTPRIKWNLAHAARVNLVSVTRLSNVVTVLCGAAHNLNTGDGVTIQDSGVVVDGTYTPVTVLSATTFTFANTAADLSEPVVGASIINSALTQTKYRLQSLGINGFTKLSRISGASPRFADSGVAVDDYATISGTTFSSLNNGMYRVVAADNDSIVFINPNTVDNVNTVIPFNNKSISSIWTANSTVITGIAGAFKGLTLGNWVKKAEDTDSAYLQVIAYNNSGFDTATQIVLGNAYSGISSISFGIAYDQTSGYDTGVFLKGNDDVAFYEGDAAITGDRLFVQNITNNAWFATNNSGSFAITKIGTNPSDLRPFVRIANKLVTADNNKNISVNIDGFNIVENDNNKFITYRTIVNSTIDDIKSAQRKLYMLPNSRQYKFSQANASFITHTGKLGFDTGVSVGTDGYLFYTGLLRRVQRTVDGFEPDQVTFPERRAVGSLVETLPPLVKNVTVVLTVTTNEGAILQDVSSNIQAVIVDYVNGLGVGQDVILSAMIQKAMEIKGVAAVTFNIPAASVERISVASNEKAIITTGNIGII